MSWMKGARARLRSLLRGGAAEARMDEEFEFHVAMATDANLRAGHSPAEARRRALVAFGGGDRYRERMREGRGLRWLADAAQDVRFALRALARAPGFAAVAVLSIGLGVGATTALYSVTSAALLRPLPLPGQDRLFSVQEQRSGMVSQGTEGNAVPYARYLEYAAAADAWFSGLAAQRLRTSFSLRVGGEAVPVSGTISSGNLFQVLGLTPAAGRFFTADDEPVIVLGHRFWQNQLGGDPGVIGRTVHLDGRALTIAGVAPRGFGGTTVGIMADLWVPVGAYAQGSGGGFASWVVPFGRLRPGVDAAAAAAAIDGIARRIPPGEPQTTVRGARLDPMTGMPEQGRQAARMFLGMLLGTAGLVLLIATANIAALLLARTVARRRELAVRLAIGAGRFRVARLLLTESLVVCLLGGAAGMLIAIWATRLIAAIRLPIPEPVAFDLGPDLGVFAFAFLVAAAAGLLAGLAPALQSTRPELTSALKDGAPSGGSRAARGRSAFVAAQLSMAVLLLVVAGLFVRSLQSALAAEPGFDARGVVVAPLNLGPFGYDEDQGRAFYGELLERVRGVPGIDAAALADIVLLVGDASREDVQPASDDTRRTNASVSRVDPAYLDVLRVPLVSGRGFTPADGRSAPPVVMVNQTLAARLWPGENPLGQGLRSGDRVYEVIGVTRDGRYISHGEAPRAHMFFSAHQSYSGRMHLHLRTALPLSEVLERIRAEVRALDPNLAVGRTLPLPDLLEFTLLPQRFAAWLVGIFGVLGLVLAGIGVYGVLSFQVAQRTRELGIRVALGASTGDVLRLVVARGALLAVLGAAIGLGLAAAVTRFIQAFLFGVSALDPLTFLVVPAVLVAVALLASWLPARRATRVDPLAALRMD